MHWEGTTWMQSSHRKESFTLALELAGKARGRGIHHDDVLVLGVVQHLPHAPHIKCYQRNPLHLRVPSYVSLECCMLSGVAEAVLSETELI